jgi:hypothetical protein
VDGGEGISAGGCCTLDGTAGRLDAGRLRNAQTLIEGGFRGGEAPSVLLRLYLPLTIG